MLPGISCLCPTTASRRWCLPLAIRWFSRQTYAGPLELVLLSEEASELRDMESLDPRVRLCACTDDVPLGGKHELAAELAAYPWLAKWDDDDWQSPTRLEVTMRAARESGADMVSAEPLLFYELGHGRCWEYRYQLNQRWQPGNSLLFSRAVQQRVRFNWQLACGVDTDFVGRALAADVSAVVVDDAPLVVVTKHGQTTGTRVWAPKPPEFRPWAGDLGGLLGADLEALEEAYRCRRST